MTYFLTDVYNVSKRRDEESFETPFLVKSFQLEVSVNRRLKESNNESKKFKIFAAPEALLSIFYVPVISVISEKIILGQIST